MNRSNGPIIERVHRAIEERVFPGCVVGMVDREGERTVLPFGRFTYDSRSPTVNHDTVYDVASITKAVPVSCLALRLIGEGRLRLDDRLIEYVPEFSNPDREEVRVRHLLTHTLHFGFALSSLKDESPETIMRAIFQTPFASKPGRFFSYANATSILLGLVVERVYGEPLDAVSERVFFSPLGMRRTTFQPLLHFQNNEIAPTEIDPWRGVTVQGEVHDESAWALLGGRRIEDKQGRTQEDNGCEENFVPKIPGSAGLFSTAPDFLAFLQMLLGGGWSRGTPYFTEATMRSMYTNQIPHLGLCTGLGWELNQPHYMGQNCSQSTFGKTGFTGCVCLCDIEKGIGMVLLANCIYPWRKPDKESINAFRRDIADIIFYTQ